MRDDQGNWRLRRLDVYRDAEKKAHSFPPPNATRSVYPLAFSAANMTTPCLIGWASLFTSSVALGPLPLCRLLFLIRPPQFNAAVRSLLHDKCNKSVAAMRARRLLC